MNFRLKSPLSTQLEITEACNNACRHCYNYWRYIETGKRLGCDPHKRSLGHFLNLMQLLIDNEVRAITITGGEPFLRRDILFDLLKYGSKSGSTMSINTNGAMITKSDAKYLKETGVDFVLISLLCDDPAVHNQIACAKTHKKTSQGISWLIEEGLNVSVNMVVSSYNCHRVRQTAEYVRKLGVSNFSATPILPCPTAQSHAELMLSSEQIKVVLNDLLWAKSNGMKTNILEPLARCMFDSEERVRFEQLIGDRSCSAGISEMVVSPDGDVRPCIMASQVVGNLFRDGLKKCWDALIPWCSQELIPPVCLECDIVDDCGSGCRVAAQAHSGIINGRDPYMTKPLKKVSHYVTDKITTTVGPSTEVSIPEAISIRNESFGSVVFWKHKFMFLDHDGTTLMKHLITRRHFTRNSVAKEIEVCEGDLDQFLSSLNALGFLKF
jgi:radical SAM protein with 4Fe4S-binding SPASM domain